MRASTDSNLQRILSRNVRNIRERIGYSQLQLAERADISPGHMNDIEQGRKWVSERSLRNLARALMVEPWMLLLDGENTSTPSVDVQTHKQLSLFARKVRSELDVAIEDALTAALDNRSSWPGAAPDARGTLYEETRAGPGQAHSHNRQEE